MSFFFIILVFVLFPMLAGGLIVYFSIAHKRKKEKGFEFVYVEENGDVRECSFEEVEYLNRNFSPGDPQMPYLKLSYGEKINGKMVPGFILRSKVPQDIIIRKNKAKPTGLN